MPVFQAFRRTSLPQHRKSRQQRRTHCGFLRPQMQFRNFGGERKCTIFQAHQGKDPPLNLSRAIQEEAVLEQSVDSHHPLGTFLGRSSHPLFPFMKYFWFLVRKGCHDNLTAGAWSWLSLQGLTGRLQCTKAPIIYLLILTFCGQGLE